VRVCVCLGGGRGAAGFGRNSCDVHKVRVAVVVVCGGWVCGRDAAECVGTESRHYEVRGAVAVALVVVDGGGWQGAAGCGGWAKGCHHKVRAAAFMAVLLLRPKVGPKVCFHHAAQHVAMCRYWRTLKSLL
jgi:hypothetical protein